MLWIRSNLSYLYNKYNGIIYAVSFFPLISSIVYGDFFMKKQYWPIIVGIGFTKGILMDYTRRFTLGKIKKKLYIVFFGTTIKTLIGG